MKPFKPQTKTKCFFIRDIGFEAYLLDHDPSEKLSYPEDADHLYREIVEGTFYPIKNGECIDGKRIVGYFIDQDNEEFICFYNDEFIADSKWSNVENKNLRLNNQEGNKMLKTYSIAFGGKEWGWVVDCDTQSQAEEICEAFKMYYGNYLIQLEILHHGDLLKKLI